MKYSLLIFSIILLSIASCQNAFSTSTGVYGEGSYTDTQLTVNIFIDIDADVEGTLRSAGIKLVYPANKLANPVASNNQYDWYLGRPDDYYPYSPPVTSTAGEVIFTLGKFDEDSPNAGVEGRRILLGSVRFDRIKEASLPDTKEFTLQQGKPAPFDDFVTITHKQLDDFITYSPLTLESQTQLNLKGVIRTLQVQADKETDIPIRPAEFDRNDDGRVGLEDGIELLREISQ